MHLNTIALMASCPNLDADAEEAAVVGKEWEESWAWCHPATATTNHPPEHRPKLELSKWGTLLMN